MDVWYAPGIHSNLLLCHHLHTHRMLGLNVVALGLFRSVLRHNSLCRLITDYVTEDDGVFQSSGPHIRWKLRVLQLILVTVRCAAKPTVIELL